MSAGPVEASRGRWMTEAIVRGGCGFQVQCEYTLGPQEEQEVLLVTEPSLQPFLRYILNHL